MKMLKRINHLLSLMLFLCPGIIRVGGGTAKNRLPDFTYTGTYSILDDGDGNRRVKFWSSGTIVFSRNVSIDLFLVGGGGGGAGAAQYSSAGGGGGGYTRTFKGFYCEAGVAYAVTVANGGAGGAVAGTGSRGGTSWFAIQASFFSEGGYGGTTTVGGNGGSGGGGGSANNPTVAGNGGSDGSNGGNGTYAGGIGQGTTTREFGVSDGELYSGGGAGTARLAADGVNGSGEYGRGGKAGDETKTGFAGTQGIVVIRNHRAA